MVPFDFLVRTRFVSGPGTIARLGDLAAELNCRRVLVVSDPGIVEAGHTEHGLAALESAGLTTRLFTGLSENPTTDHVASGLAVAREFQPELIVGLGGGSSMDCAKGINFLYTNGGEIRDYWGLGKATKPLLPMIAVPTTAGTGSEAQSFALISDAVTHVKMACGDKKAAFRVAILDPELTLTQPRQVTALTGIDALSHALESYVTKSRSPVSMLIAREAWRLLAGHYHEVLLEPANVAARGAMQVGACLAGLAIEHSMLGAAHALANPLTATYGIPHGQAIALMLPHVIRFNGQTCEPLYCELLAAAAGEPEIPVPQAGSAGLAEFVATRIGLAGLKHRLHECGVEQDRLPQLAAHAAQQWTAAHNPRQVGEAEFFGLYSAAW